MSDKLYSIRKCRNVMKHCYAMFKKRRKKLSPDTISEFENCFIALDEALLKNDKVEANIHVKKLERLENNHLKKNLFDYGIELICALVFALLIASVVREMWFEPYEIPTGSMRPTFEEQDRLTVTKTAFGINIPFTPKHFYFNENLVERGGIVIFSGNNIDLPDTDTKYFWLFPVKKSYIKRMIGKPGDTLYFYGGKIYGIDKYGNQITDFDNTPWFNNLEHIPFLTFDGKIEGIKQNQIAFKQMNLPLGRITFDDLRGVIGQVYDDGKWTNPNRSDGVQYSDFFGIRNFAMARLLTKTQANQQGHLLPEELNKGVLYLELSHHPSLTYPEPHTDPQSIYNNTILGTQKTLIPLDEEEIQTLMNNMYTARFVIQNNHAARYSADSAHFTKFSPRFPKVPNGTYEFYYGKGWSVGWGGILHSLPPDHPLYDRSPENIQRLFNLGIDLITLKEPNSNNQNYFPHRYAYFRDGDLYVLGAPLLKKGSETLVNFEKREEEKVKNSLPRKPYLAFKDYGSPVKNGEIDKKLIEKYGVKIPEGYYLVLGDNHAMSADSRVFGFIPQGNLKGAPSLILWPPGDRFGFPLQKPYPIINLPRLIVWVIAGIIALIAYLIHRRKIKRPIFDIKKIEQQK